MFCCCVPLRREDYLLVLQRRALVYIASLCFRPRVSYGLSTYVADGLWDVMDGLEAVEIALASHSRAPSSTGRAPSWARALSNGVAGENAEADPANALVKEAVKRGTADNVTAIVAILPWD